MGDTDTKLWLHELYHRTVALGDGDARKGMVKMLFTDPFWYAVVSRCIDLNGGFVFPRPEDAAVVNPLRDRPSAVLPKLTESPTDHDNWSYLADSILHRATLLWGKGFKDAACELVSAVLCSCSKVRDYVMKSPDWKPWMKLSRDYVLAPGYRLLHKRIPTDISWGDVGIGKTDTRGRESKSKKRRK